MISNKFNVKKALQILFYLQKNGINKKERSKYLYLLKLFFLSDRFHIRNFAMPILKTNYDAKKFGPLSKEMDAVLVNPDLLPSLTKKEKQEIFDNVTRNKYNSIIKEQGNNLLSDSVKRSLDFAISNFSHFGRFELSNITHDYPEWNNTADDEVMNYIDFFDNPVFKDTKYLKKYFKIDPFTMPEDELNFNKNQFRVFA